MKLWGKLGGGLIGSWLVVGVVWLSPVRAAEPSMPNIGINKVSEQRLGIKLLESIWTPEMSLSVVKQADGSRLYATGGVSSVVCRSNGNVLESTLANPLQLTSASCQTVSKPEIIEKVNNDGSVIFKPVDNMTVAGWENRLKDWNRTYDGITSMAIIDTSVGKRLVALRHGENSNIKTEEGLLFQNPMFYPEVPVNQAYKDVNGVDWPDGCYSGSVGGEYKHCWDSFASFANLMATPYEPGSGWQKDKNSWTDEGPVVWPSKGIYINEERRPGGAWGYLSSLFYDQGQLYIFSHRFNCLNLARLEKTSTGGLSGWKNYYNNDFSQPALPQGFTKDRIRNYYTQIGEKAECLINDQRLGYGINYFKVARIKNSSYYIAALEESFLKQNYPPNGFWQMGVKFSADLIHWTPTQVLAVANGEWGEGWYAYPTFFDKEATTNFEIDANDFYIVGVHATGSAGYEHQAMRLSLVLKPPADKIAAVVRQYFQQILGREPGDVQWHTDYLADNGCQADLRNIISGPEFTNGRMKTTTDEEYIQLLFRGVLAREPGSLDYFLQKLHTGTSRGQVAEEIITSKEANDACLGGKILPACTKCSEGTKAFSLGNSNCDEKVNGLDFGFWQKVMTSSSATEDQKAKADYNCTAIPWVYTVDLTDVKIWAVNY